MSDRPFWSVFDRVATKLDRKDIDVDLDAGEPVTAPMLKSAERILGFDLPEELAAMYRDVGDGVSLRWQHPEEDRCFANVQFPPLVDLARTHLRWYEIAVRGKRSYDFRFTTNPPLAKETLKQMGSWIKIHAEGNGDAFVIDRSTGRVIYHQHDWFDGGDGRNGAVMGESLLDFIENWSTVAFQYPRTLWWNSVVVKGAVDWKHRDFKRV